MKRIILILGNIALYFVIALCVAFVSDKIRPIDSVWVYALYMTIGWGIWQTIVYVFRKVRKKDNTNLCTEPIQEMDYTFDWDCEECFIIDDTDFKVGKVYSTIENDEKQLEIYGDKETFDNLTEDEDSKWGWALYEPKLYFWGLKQDKTEFDINDRLKEECDFALYMMEHNFIHGKLAYKNDKVQFKGIVELDENVPIHVCAKLK